MAIGLLSSAVSGLAAAQIGLQTAEHNITNQNTPGFNRQRIIQAANIAMLTGSGYIGQGAHVSTVERMYDSFLSNQVNLTQSSASELETYYTQISRIDNLVADANAGLSPALQKFFNGVQQVAANPSLVSTRQAMVSQAQAMVARFQGLENSLSQLYDGVNQQLVTQVATVNSYSQQIAELNQSIILARSATNQPPNDLMDQRDRLVNELNKLIKVTTTTNTDGSFNVFFGTGQQLVVGTQVNTLTAAASSADNARIVVGLSNNGTIQELPESLLTGGAIGGLVKFRSDGLDTAYNELGRSAASLALTFNAQNALGQDLLGQKAGDPNFVANFFNISAPKVVANSNNAKVTPAVVTASFNTPSVDGAYTLSLNGGGTTYTLTRQSDGTAWTGANLAALQAAIPASEGLTVTGATVAAGASTQVFGAVANGSNFYTKLTTSDYRLDYNGANYSMTRLSDGKQWTNATLGGLSTLVSGSEGFSLASPSGTFVAGDSFTIRPVAEVARNLSLNPAVAADARLVAAAMPFRTAASTTNSGSGTISAGEAVFGYAANSVPAGGVSLTYASGTNQLTLAGVPAGANISVEVGSTTTVYAGPTIPYTSGAKITYAGTSFSISGNLANGDSFTLAQNAVGVSDGRNALALGKLQTQNTMSGKTATFQASYAQMVSDVGNKARQASVNLDAQKSLLKQSQTARDSLSGVNLDEEAANLIRYQQAYQASAKALQIGANLFDVVIGIMK